MNKLFANDKLLLGAFLVSIISFFAIIVLKAVQAGGDFLHYDWFIVVIYFVCEFAMFVSYKNHNKNVMKGMIGATLMALIMDGLFTATTETIGGVVTCAVLYTIISVLMFITHFLINSDHHSNAGSVRTNIVFCIIFAVINVAWCIVVGFNILSILYMLATIGLVVTLVSIEAKLDIYRIEREAAGWSEDKGYPEGFVHGHEKNKK